MGTSVNQASHRSTNWVAASLGYQSESVPIERVVTEVWRAARKDAERDWAEMLSSQAVLSCLRIALESSNTRDALNLASREIARSRQSSLATDIAKRAIVLSSTSSDRTMSFQVALFTETTNYLVSRDLPGFIGPNGRNRTISEAVTFKSEIRQRVAEILRPLELAPGLNTNSWNSFVQAAMNGLTGVQA